MLLDETTSALDPEMVGGVLDVIRSIADASKRSDLTIFSLHTHEGVNENWYSSQPPEFIEKIAHNAIDAGESIIAPEMYEAYGYGADSRPSDLHSNRAKDKNGNFIGFSAERRFSENCLLQIDRNEDGSVAYGLIPIDLTMENERVQERGLPKIASTEVAAQIAEHMTDYSAPYGTKLTYDKESGLIRIA